VTCALFLTCPVSLGQSFLSLPLEKGRLRLISDYSVQRFSLAGSHTIEFSHVFCLGTEQLQSLSRRHL
jgi:hypothetical protein